MVRKKIEVTITEKIEVKIKQKIELKLLKTEASPAGNEMCHFRTARFRKAKSSKKWCRQEVVGRKTDRCRRITSLVVLLVVQ